MKKKKREARDYNKKTNIQRSNFNLTTTIKLQLQFTTI